jgi:hypothetical protein
MYPKFVKKVRTMLNELQLKSPCVPLLPRGNFLCGALIPSLEKRGRGDFFRRHQGGQYVAPISYSTLVGILIATGVLLLGNFVLLAAQAPDGTVKIISRSVAPGVGLSWGDGILSYHGQDYPFTFKANGLFRDVDSAMTAAELSGQVFNLKSPSDFGGNYQKVEAANAESGAGSRASLKNQNGVVVNLQSSIAGRKFNLSREGLNIEFKKPKP